MGSTIRYLAVAAAVVIAAVIGMNFVPTGSGVGARSASTPTPAPTPTPIPLPTGSDVQTLSVAGGTYLVDSPFPIAITVTVPGGWGGNIGGPYAAYLERTGAYGSQAPDIAFTLSQDLYADTCAGTSFLVPQPGATVDDLVTSLASLPGVKATAPVDVAIDGLPGKQLTLTASSSSPGCSPPTDGYFVWRLPLGAVFSVAPGQSMVVRILEVGSQRLVISSDTFANTTATDIAQMQQILDSIHFANPR